MNLRLDLPPPSFASSTLAHITQLQTVRHHDNSGRYKGLLSPKPNTKPTRLPEINPALKKSSVFPFERSTNKLYQSFDSSKPTALTQRI